MISENAPLMAKQPTRWTSRRHQRYIAQTDIKGVLQEGAEFDSPDPFATADERRRAFPSCHDGLLDLSVAGDGEPGPVSLRKRWNDE